MRRLRYFQLNIAPSQSTCYTFLENSFDILYGQEKFRLEYQFDWDPDKDQQNRRKHRFSFRHAATVFRDPFMLSVYDDEHSEDEDRWITLGLDSSGILRVIVHTFEQSTPESMSIRIISARAATAAEARQYEGKNI